MDNFWKNYQYLCAKKGVSVYEAAKACGVKGTGTVSYWKHGSKPNADNLNKMVEYFGVDAYQLVYGDIEAADKANSFAGKAINDPLYNAILNLTPQQRTLVQGFIAGLMAKSDISL